MAKPAADRWLWWKSHQEGCHANSCGNQAGVLGRGGWRGCSPHRGIHLGRLGHRRQGRGAGKRPLVVMAGLDPAIPIRKLGALLSEIAGTTLAIAVAIARPAMTIPCVWHAV